MTVMSVNPSEEPAAAHHLEEARKAAEATEEARLLIQQLRSDNTNQG